ITIILYAIIGFKQGSGIADTSQLNAILTGLSEHFQIGIIPALPMLLVLGLLIRQTNPVLAIVSGALFGVLIAVGYAGMDLTTAFNSMWSGYKADFANPMLAKLLNRGGITSMLDIAALVIFACGLGGMLRHIGIIDAVLEPVARRATSGLSLVLATLFIGYGTLMLTAAAYFSIVMNGTVMAPLFRKRGYRPENCSRVVEDAGTLGGPLVPWASNALFPMSMLSVSYMDYAPWAFVLYLTPLMSILYAAFNINMTRLTPEEMAEENKEFVVE
ncbi:MAG: Na+/H+ antiporter NhaC, partial [Bilophila sp.]|nr:Na+/H+ antiporter NhaC [Bilophila sp.]